MEQCPTRGSLRLLNCMCTWDMYIVPATKPYPKQQFTDTSSALRRFGSLFRQTRHSERHSATFSQKEDPLQSHSRTKHRETNTNRKQQLQNSPGRRRVWQLHLCPEPVCGCFLCLLCFRINLVSPCVCVCVCFSFGRFGGVHGHSVGPT